MSIIKKLATLGPAKHILKGDWKNALKSAHDPLGIILKKKKKKAVEPPTQRTASTSSNTSTKRMKKGGKVTCRGMGAATRGGKYHP